MSDFNRGYARSVPTDRADMSVDAGLRAFMLGVYNKMALGLLISAALAWVTGQFAPVQQLLYRVTPDGHLAGYTGLGTVVAYSPLAIMLFMLFGMRNPTVKGSGILYWATVSVFGAGLGALTLLYTGASLASTFLITASAFGVLSLVGYTTKRDLTGFGSFLMMGLWGLVIAMLVGMFWHPAGFSVIISALGVLIFAGLTAYNTQRLKMTYYQLSGNQVGLGVATNYGALTLYLDFLNLFLFLLRFTGSRR
jgi:hypothetical protein